MSVESKLKELDVILPEPLKPLEVCVPAVRIGTWVSVSRMVSMQNGIFKCKRKVGKDLTLEHGYEAARISGVNALRL